MLLITIRGFQKLMNFAKKEEKRMVRKTIAAAVALCAFAVTPAMVFAQNDSTQSQIIYVMPMPEKDYGTTMFNSLSAKDQTAFIDYLKTFTPYQRQVIVRELHTYGVSDEKPFAADATADMVYPVLKSISQDRDAFDTLWTSMTSAQKTDFIVYARDFYHMAPTTTTTYTTATTPQGVEIFTAMPSPVDQYGNTIYTTIPVSDQPGFITYLTGFPPDQRVTIVRSLHYYSIAPNLTPFTMDTTPTVAYPIFTNAVLPEDQASFTAMWNSMTPEQQNNYVMFARDVYPPLTTTTTTTTVTTPVTTQVTTPVTDTSGTAAQPLGVTMAAAFVGYLTEPSTPRIR